MHIVTIALIGALALEGRARLPLMPLVRFTGISVFLLAAGLIGIRAFYIYKRSHNSVDETAASGPLSLL